MPSEAIRPKDLLPDAAITSWAVKYGTGPAFNDDQIAPVVPVARPDFKFATYKADELNDEVETVVAPGDRPALVRRFAPSYTSASTIRHALDDFITDEVARQAPNPMFLEQRRTQKLVANLKLAAAKRIKAKFDAAGSAASAPSTKWGASSGTAIEKALDDAREAVLAACGYEATHVIIPAAVARTMKRSPEIRDLRKYVEPGLLVNGDLPSVLFGLNVVIPGALHNSGNPKADESQTIARVWSDDTVYVCHMDPSAADTEAFAPVIQARWLEWGQPFAGYVWRDPHQSVRGRWISVEVHQVEVTPASAAVYRIPDVLA